MFSTCLRAADEALDPSGPNPRGAADDVLDPLGSDAGAYSVDALYRAPNGKLLVVETKYTHLTLTPANMRRAARSRQLANNGPYQMNDRWISERLLRTTDDPDLIAELTRMRRNQEQIQTIYVFVNQYGDAASGLRRGATLIRQQ